MLIVARFLQGAAGAVASAVILGMVIGLFPESGERARAIGIYSFVGAAGAAIGLLAGGVLDRNPQLALGFPGQRADRRCHRSGWPFEYCRSIDQPSRVVGGGTSAARC